ncbi:MAG: ammonia channel protein, partial [Candidatus Margulisiibacteriota bacterium]
MNAGDTAWVLISFALVILMTPALGFFYAGMARKKNILSTLMLSVSLLVLISVQWVLYGYSIAFGPDKGGLIGGLNWIGLNGISPIHAGYAPTIPHTAFILFQMAFAVITPALIAGAFIERIKFSGFLL